MLLLQHNTMIIMSLWGYVLFYFCDENEREVVSEGRWWHFKTEEEW